VILAADAAFAWAILQSSDVLTTPEDSLPSLTTQGSKAVLRQQEWLGLIINFWPLITIVIAAIGLALIIGGLLRWVPMQKVQDDTDRAVLHGHLSHASPEEKRDAARADAAEALVDGVISATDDDKVAATVLRHLEIEDEVVDVVTHVFLSSHIVERDVRIKTDDGRISLVDLLLTARNSKDTSFVIEIKAARVRPISRTRLSGALLATGTAVQMLSSLLDRPFRGLVLFVVDHQDRLEDTNWPPQPVVSADPRSFASAVVVSRDSLPSLRRNAESLRRLFEA